MQAQARKSLHDSGACPAQAEDGRRERREGKAREQQARQQAHEQWSRQAQASLREQLPAQTPRPVAVKREATSITLNLRRDVAGDAAVVGLLWPCTARLSISVCACPARLWPQRRWLHVHAHQVSHCSATPCSELQQRAALTQRRLQLTSGQYQLGCKPASGGGDWTLHQAAATSSPIITCPNLEPGTRYLFRGRIGAPRL